jgi:hypothetical protein
MTRNVVTVTALVLGEASVAAQFAHDSSFVVLVMLAVFVFC